ncbi:MAG: universal stress protein [Saprospiraceae bacterium]|nr:universal stress protein [Saprospiraceae bacterium]
MKPSILVPVDFTDNAFNAYLYANNLAYYLDCTLHLIYVLPISSDSESSKRSDLARGEKEVLQSKLRSFSRWHPNEIIEKFFPVETSVEVALGDTAEQVIKCANKGLFRFIVCGTRERHSSREKWLGTVSSNIAMQAGIPVILVPNHAAFTNLDTIVVGCDEHANDDFVLAQIAILSDWFESQVHFVHVQQGSQDFEVIERDILEALVALQKKTLKVEMATIEGVDVVSALFHYASEKKADLLIMISEKRSFLKDLLFQSMTRKTAQPTSVPTMIIHV